MSKIHLTAIAFASLTFISCGDDVNPEFDAKTEQPTQEDVTTKDGIPHFASVADYNDFSLRMANSDPEARRICEKRLGYTSMLSYAERVTADAELHMGEALGRPDIFSVAEDSTVTLEVPDAFASATDADGYFYIGNSICKVDKEFTASVVDGCKEDVDAAIRNGAVPEGRDGSVYRYAGNGNLKAGYVGKKASSISERLRDGSYRMDYTIKVYVSDCDLKTGQFIIQVEQKSTNGYKKHKRWRQHHSENTYRNVSCDVAHPYLQEAAHHSIPNYFGNSRVNHSKTEPFYINGVAGVDYRSATPYFTNMNGTIICESVPKAQIDLWMLFNGYNK